MSIKKITGIVGMGLCCSIVSISAFSAARNVDINQINIINNSQNGVVYKCAVYGVTGVQDRGSNLYYSRYIMNNSGKSESNFAIAANPVTALYFNPYNPDKYDELVQSTFDYNGVPYEYQAYRDSNAKNPHNSHLYSIGLFSDLPFPTNEPIPIIDINDKSYGSLYGIYSPDGSDNKQDWSDVKHKKNKGVNKDWQAPYAYEESSFSNTVLLYDNQYITPGGEFSQIFEFINSRSKHATDKAEHNFGVRCEVYRNIDEARAGGKKVQSFYVENALNHSDESSKIVYGSSDELPGAIEFTKVGSQSGSGQGDDGGGVYNDEVATFNVGYIN